MDRAGFYEDNEVRAARAEREALINEISNRRKGIKSSIFETPWDMNDEAKAHDRLSQLNKLEAIFQKQEISRRDAQAELRKTYAGLSPEQIGKLDFHDTYGVSNQNKYKEHEFL